MDLSVKTVKLSLRSNGIIYQIIPHCFKVEVICTNSWKNAKRRETIGAWEKIYKKTMIIDFYFGQNKDWLF